MDRHALVDRRQMGRSSLEVRRGHRLVDRYALEGSHEMDLKVHFCLVEHREKDQEGRHEMGQGVRHQMGQEDYLY